MSKGVTLEMMADIAGFAGPGKRVLARDGEGAWYLVEIAASGDRRILSEPVTIDVAATHAVAILAGDDRTLTRSQARLSIAVAVSAIWFLAHQSTSGGAPPPATAALPPGDPPAPGGDLFNEGPRS